MKEGSFENLAVCYALGTLDKNPFFSAKVLFSSPKIWRMFVAHHVNLSDNLDDTLGRFSRGSLAKISVGERWPSLVSMVASILDLSRGS